MASSSVSQDDIDNDFEKNSRRSRIRTARARQINPSSQAAATGASLASCRLEMMDEENDSRYNNDDNEASMMHRLPNYHFVDITMLAMLEPLAASWTPTRPRR